MLGIAATSAAGSFHMETSRTAPLCTIYWSRTPTLAWRRGRRYAVNTRAIAASYAAAPSLERFKFAANVPARMTARHERTATDLRRLRKADDLDETYLRRLPARDRGDSNALLCVV